VTRSIPHTYRSMRVNGEQLARFLPLLLIVLAFYFLVLRPARRRQRDAQELQQQLSVGSTVMLTSGVFGEITVLSDEAVSLRVSPQVTLPVHRNAVGRILSDEEIARMRTAGLLDVRDHTSRPAD